MSDKVCIVQFVMYLSFRSTEEVIVYGSTIEAYICINGLLSSGVSGSCVSHVHPPRDPPSCFNDPHIEDIMKRTLDQLGKGFIRFF